MPPAAEKMFAAFDESKPSDPMTCCVFLADRIRTRLDLADPLREGASEGQR